MWLCLPDAKAKPIKIRRLGVLDWVILAELPKAQASHRQKNLQIEKRATQDGSISMFLWQVHPMVLLCQLHHVATRKNVCHLPKLSCAKSEPYYSMFAEEAP